MPNQHPSCPRLVTPHPWAENRCFGDPKLGDVLAYIHWKPIPVHLLFTLLATIGRIAAFVLHILYVGGSCARIYANIFPVVGHDIQ
jgi:hypothetical protein